MIQEFVRVAAAVPKLNLANPLANAEHHIGLVQEGKKKGASVIVFPELSLSGYTCADLFHQTVLISESKEALFYLAKKTSKEDILIVVGVPYFFNGSLYNCAAVLHKGKILALVPKTYLPNSREFYENRWFSKAPSNPQILDPKEPVCPIGANILISTERFTLGIELCEDLWAPIPPSSYHALAGADLIVNLSASNELTGKQEYRKLLVNKQSGATHCGYVYCSSGNGESSTDTVFSGSVLISENGQLLKESERYCDEDLLLTADIDIGFLRRERLSNCAFKSENKEESLLNKEHLVLQSSVVFPKKNITLDRWIDAHPFIPKTDLEKEERCSEIVSIVTEGLKRRLNHLGCQKMHIGISGGLDSTLALLFAVETADKLKMDRKNICAVSMPGFGTTGRTKNNGQLLCESLGVSFQTLSITEETKLHFKTIAQSETDYSTTYENSQARIRTLILMNLANKESSLVLGTGDLSELALGWCTYNGDHMSMYGVNSSIPKTLVRTLISWFQARYSPQTRSVLEDILKTPVSPELLPPSKEGTIAQETESIVGPYELHDFFLYHLIRRGSSPEKIEFLANQAFSKSYSQREIRKWLVIFIKRFFSQQFKRSALPDGPKVGSVSLSPRGDWKMPSDCPSHTWLKWSTKNG